jgi:hypothetical protein
VPYTFGAAATDDITWSLGASIGNSSRISLVAGWWRPTTLTATRKLWSAGTAGINGAEIDTTTDELRLRTDNTTDGQWTTTGVDLVVDEWKFLAFLLSCNNTGPAAAWRVWSGDVSNAPIERTVTVATSPTGSFTSTVAFYIGNASTGSLAFEGDIANVTVSSTGFAVGVTTNPFGIAAYGTITNEEAQHIYETMVLPLWLGDPSPLFRRPQDVDSATYHNGLDQGAVVVGNHRSSATLMPSPGVTINGATPASTGAPRPHPGMVMLPRPRR